MGVWPMLASRARARCPCHSHRLEATPMQLIGLQLDIAWEDRERNHARVREMLAKNPPQRDALITLPEMFASGFSMNVKKIAEDATRATESFLGEVSREYRVYLVGGLATIGADG